MSDISQYNDLVGLWQHNSPASRIAAKDRYLVWAQGVLASPSSHQYLVDSKPESLGWLQSWVNQVNPSVSRATYGIPSSAVKPPSAVDVHFTGPAPSAPSVSTAPSSLATAESSTISPPGYPLATPPPRSIADGTSSDGKEAVKPFTQSSTWDGGLILAGFIAMIGLGYYIHT